MAVDPPADLEAVRYAFRLGWAIAELRGRYRPDRHNWRSPGGGTAFKRGAFQLPLSGERSPAEIRVELVDTVEDLSEALKLDQDPHVADAWRALKPALEACEKSPTDQSLWGVALPAFYKWDTHVQDALVLMASQAAGYQLGRGLAETYWGLEPDRTDGEMGSWAFVLGERRRETLQRLAARLSSYFGPLVVAAIDGPLADWAKLATEPARRLESDVEVDLDLFRQGLLWRDLVRGERQPQDLPLSPDLEAPGPAELWKGMKLYRDTLSSIRQPLIVAVFSVVVLVGGGALIATGGGHGALGTVAALLGALGVTSAGLYARAKATVTPLLATLKTRVEVERVRQAANLCP